MAANRKRTSDLSIVQAAAAGAASVGVIYLACWIGTRVPGLSVSHMFLALFTTADPRSTTALAQGFGWSLVFGGLAAALIAFFYNRFAFLGRTR